MKYSLVANECVSWILYKDYQPGINEMFVDYTNPFISSWFPDDEGYVRLCENYEYYTSIEPRFGDPINHKWEKDAKNKRSMNAILAGFGNYAVMFLGDVEIHWTRDINSSLLLQKFKGRLENSKGRELVFLWSDAQIFNIHTEEERNNLIKRFNAINHKTIFLTKYPGEEYRDEKTIVKFVPDWAGKSQHDRNAVFLLNWYNNYQLSPIFKELIDNFERNNN
jgi:hypothetical protein